MYQSAKTDFSTLLVKQWSKTLDLIADIFDIPTVLIMKIDNEKIKVFSVNQNEKTPYNIDDAEVLDGSGLYCEHVIKNQELLEVSNALTDPNWDKNPDIALNQIYYLGVPITYSDGQPFGTLCILDDHERSFQEKYHRLLIHLKKDIENQLQTYDQHQQLVTKQNLQYVENIICGMAHQLNTPTGISITALSTLDNALKEFSTNLYSKKITTDKFHKFEKITSSCIELLQTNLDKTSHLVDRFKDISSQFSSQAKRINLNTFFTDMVAAFSSSFPTQASFSLECPQNIYLVTIPKLLQNVITQLVENSIEHAFEKADPSTNNITISLKAINNNVAIHYKDNGKGITNDISEDIFTPFCQLSSNKNNIGLGLSVIKNITVIQLKGDIDLVQCKQGTAFNIRLPNLH